MASDDRCMPSWIQQAAGMPLAFAQVREDPRLDRWVIDQLAAESSRALSVIQIASGGCTAALLATLPQVGHLHLVDPNPAQLGLTRVKLHLVQHHEPVERMQILGHAVMPHDLRASQLRDIMRQCGLPEDCLGPEHDLARKGADFCGRYELLFAQLQRQLEPMSQPLMQLLKEHDPERQRELMAPGCLLGQAVDETFEQVLTLANLSALFGDKATGNAARPFSEHFRSRLRCTLCDIPAATNPFLWQLLVGRYPPGHAVDVLQLPRHTRPVDISWTAGTMDQALQEGSRRYDFIHLSNILDWLAPDEAARTLSLAWDNLNRGGAVIIRQLNSLLEIPTLAPQFSWNRDAGSRLLRQDRSFFYRALHLGRKT